MFRCPNCREPTFSAMAKLMTDSIPKRTCRSCGKKIGVSWVASTAAILASLWIGLRFRDAAAVLELWLALPYWVLVAAMLVVMLAVAVALFLVMVPLVVVPSRAKTIDRVVFYVGFALFFGYHILTPISHDGRGHTSARQKAESSR